jgi:hypothetical protein
VNISPDYAPHQTLERRVADYLHESEFETGNSTYHETYAPALRRILQRTFEPTSLYIRAKADRVAAHRTLPLVFEWDAKTHKSSQYADCTLEVLPIALHLANAAFDVRCLYAYHNPFTGHECGFWIHDMPRVRAIHIPDRWTPPLKKWFGMMFFSYFPDTPVRETRWRGGSGDPYLIIDRYDVEQLPHWQSLIAQELEDAS